jgi:hypothetical protein
MKDPFGGIQDLFAAHPLLRLFFALLSFRNAQGPSPCH